MNIFLQIFSKSCFYSKDIAKNDRFFKEMHKFENHLKESCQLYIDQHFSFKYFPNDAFIQKILSKTSDYFGKCSRCEWVIISLPVAT